MTASSRATRALATLAPAALVAGLTLGVPTPARAAVAVDCSTGPVTLTESTEVYTLGGACRDVRVTGSNVTVSLASATSLTITGSNTRVVASGALGPVLVKAANSAVTARTGTTVKIKGANNKVVFRKLRKVVVRGANNVVRVKAGKTSVKVRGANNVIRVHKRVR
ncbi:DUF3060 domain-containing protein [Pimelobacter simplex]|uniref:DUF3060 domain-containing protein n=1 Tax=Nocardioides simplex TaxID=2045 RepID=UPI003AAF802D